MARSKKAFNDALNRKFGSVENLLTDLGKAMGIIGGDGKQASCTGRSGYLKMKNKESGEYEVACYNGSKEAGPRVFDCEHEALDSIVKLYRAIAHTLLEENRLDELEEIMPSPSDFIYVHIEEEEPEDEAIEDVSQAAGFLSALLEKR